MLGEDSYAILHKIRTVSGGGLKLDISHTCFCVLCFVCGILFSYIIITDNDEPYPVNSMTLKDVSVLVDIEAKAALNGERYEELAAISAMQIVNAIVSDYRMKAAENVSSFQHSPGNAADKGWRSSSGFCSTRVYVMLEIMKYLHIPAREINFWHIDGTDFGYAACEVYYNDSWHYFDPTFGLFFRDSQKNILSLQSILQLPTEEGYSYLVMDYTNLQNTLYNFKDSLMNVIGKESIITVAGNSNIVFDFKKNNSLSFIPTYIGILKNWSGEKSEAKYTIVFDDDMDEVNVYYKPSDEIKRVALVDGDGNVIKSIDTDVTDRVICIKKEMLTNNAITLQADNADTYGLLFLEKIEGIYKNGNKVYSK